jgi:hypothetical protein
VDADQAIPPGLHVRLDMQTGLRQAKLLEPSEQTGIKTLSEKRRAKLDIMAPLLARGSAPSVDGVPLTDLTEEVSCRLSPPQPAFARLLPNEKFWKCFHSRFSSRWYPQVAQAWRPERAEQGDVLQMHTSLDALARSVRLCNRIHVKIELRGGERVDGWVCGLLDGWESLSTSLLWSSPSAD